MHFAGQVLIAGCLSLMGCRVGKLAWEADLAGLAKRSFSFEISNLDVLQTKDFILIR